MTYNAIAAAAQDADLRLRIAAAIAAERTGGAHPLTVADDVQWRCAGEPGWGAAYASAQASSAERPGADPAVITDQMVLSAVQKFVPILETAPNAMQTLNALDETVAVLAAEILGA